MKENWNVYRNNKKEKKTSKKENLGVSNIFSSEKK